MWSRPGMQRDRSRWRRSFGFSPSGFGGRIIWHLTRRRSRNGWCDITNRRPGGRLWCWLRQRLLGKDQTRAAYFSLQKLPPLSCGSFDDLESQLGRSPLERVDLPLAVLNLVELRSSVHEVHAEAQHAVQQAGQL